ncbi:MAG: acetate--CoA ligase family protein [Spirochaetes bacterium]|nr:acetate--CoA ligase family protein [Spirochaetota bacterium]
MKPSFDFTDVFNDRIKSLNLIISEVESKSILLQYGIPVPRGIIVKTVEEIKDDFLQLSFPVVAKIASRELLHKTEIGGVITNINNTHELIDAYHTLIANGKRYGFTIEEILIEEQVNGTIEIIAGITNDPVFGPVLMAGIGGIYTHILDDVSFCLLPAKENSIIAMLKKLKGYPLIQGHRGRRININGLVDIFIKLGTFASYAAHYIQSVDCNPIIVNETQCVVADASITLFHKKIDNPFFVEEPNSSLMDTFFKPGSVAVVGASSVENKIGHVIVDCLTKSNFGGTIYPINPTQRTILGLPAYSSLNAIPKVPDIVIIAVDLGLVPSILDDMAALGCHNAIIISGGGKELGGSREELEQTIAAKARQYNIRIIGPNCIGTFDSFSQFDSFFYHVDRFSRPCQGQVSFITQSGTWGVTFMELSHKTGMSKMISYGNRVDVDEADMIAYLAHDANTRVIASYIEGLGKGRKYLKAVEKALHNKKPVVVFKTGRTQQAAHASLSHTGAYGGSYKLYRDIFEESGLIVTDSLHECFAASLALSWQPPAKGNRVALVSNGAGPMVNALDHFDHKSLELAPLGKDTLESMREHFSFFYIIQNPIDITGSATSDDYDYVMTQLMQDDAVDIIMPFFVFQNTPLDEAIVEKIATHNAAKKKPIVCCCTEGVYSTKMKDKLMQQGIPVYTHVNEWVVAAYAVMQWGKILSEGSICKSLS